MPPRSSWPILFRALRTLSRVGLGPARLIASTVILAAMKLSSVVKEIASFGAYCFISFWYWLTTGIVAENGNGTAWVITTPRALSPATLNASWADRMDTCRSCGRQTLHFARQRLGADRHIEMAVGDRQVEVVAPREALDQGRHQLAAERVELERLGVMDALAVERAQELRRILVRIHRAARRGLRRLVQARGIRRADLDPGLECTGEIAHRDRRLVGFR